MQVTEFSGEPPGTRTQALVLNGLIKLSGLKVIEND